MTKLLTTSLLVIASNICFSQNATNTQIKADSVIKMVPIKQGKYYSVAYAQAGAIITSRELENQLLSYNSSAIEFQLYKTVRQQKNTGAIICESVGLLALVAANIQAGQQSNVPGPPFNKAPALFSISIGGMLGGCVFLAVKNDHLKKAIDIFNKRFL